MTGEAAKHALPLKGGGSGRGSSRFNRTPVKTAKARQLRRDMTNAEHRLWSRLRGAQLGGFSFRRQHPMGPYVADFYCAKAKLVVELDGGQHSTGSNMKRGEARDIWLAGRGIRTLRFWNHEVNENIEGVLERTQEIAAARIGERPITRTPTQPSPLQGEGMVPEAHDLGGE